MSCSTDRLDASLTHRGVPRDENRAARSVLAAIAGAVLGESDDVRDAMVAGMTLRPHQREALRRVRALLARDGGALLADEVGMGKTLVAIALLREARAPVVVAPAALRDMWTRALARAGLAAPLVSFEGLSRGRAVATRPDLVVIDEAHHVRTPSTRRYAAVAALVAGARTLLLSATPIHNRARDLASLLALFLGASAHALDEAALARHVVRHTRADVDDGASPLPALGPPRRLDLPRETDVLDALLALPPPVPPSDGGDGGALVAYTLVRQWASSRGALRGALRRRLATAGALDDAFAAGRTPTRADLSAWTHSEGVVQLAFAELLSPPPTHPPTAALRDAVRAHATGVRELLALLARTPDPDRSRADALRTVRRAHPRARIVAFSERAETVDALFALLRGDPGVAALTAAGGRVASGRCSRRDVLTRFAPSAGGHAEPAVAERVELLLTTDLLSEGVSLHDASVVVHLDLPWSPARLEQRVGRVRRLGSPHERVHVYVMPPPAPAERLLDVERRLRRKLAIASRAVGMTAALIPALFDEPPPGDEPESGEAVETTRLRSLLTGWLDTGVMPAALDGPPPAVVAPADEEGFVALVLEHGERRVVASLAGAVSDAPAVVRRAVASVREIDAVHEDRGESACAIAEARAAVGGWLRARAGATLAGLAGPASAPSRRRVLDRIAGIANGAARHRRAPLAPLLAEARRAALAPLGVGAEGVLDALAESPLDDEGWLRAVGTFGRLHAPGGALARERPDAPRLLALVLLRRAPAEAQPSPAPPSFFSRSSDAELMQ